MVKIGKKVTEKRPKWTFSIIMIVNYQEKAKKCINRGTKCQFIDKFSHLSKIWINAIRKPGSSFFFFISRNSNGHKNCSSKDIELIFFAFNQKLYLVFRKIHFNNYWWYQIFRVLPPLGPLCPPIALRLVYQNYKTYNDLLKKDDDFPS